MNPISLASAGMSLVLVGLGGFAALTYLVSTFNQGILTVFVLLSFPCLALGFLLFKRRCLLLCGPLALATLVIIEKLNEIGSADLYLWLINVPLFPGLSHRIEAELTVALWDQGESALIMSHFLIAAALYAGISLYSLILGKIVKRVS